MKEAYLYETLEEDKVRCRLCNHRCLIKPGARGICGVRENRSGTLESLVYGQLIAGNCDPIEKKPLFHFLPGTSSYSIATVGCNFRCLFCQNADISQMPVDQNRILGDRVGPEDIVRAALRTGASSISYTYTEPTVYFETALDTARVAAKEGLKNVFVTNGYMTKAALDEIHPDLHAANVDLKAFSDRFYREQCGARLDPVLRTIKTMKKMGIWVEVTTLLIPGLNDTVSELEQIAEFLVSVDPYLPWHVSRFHPTYRLTNTHATPAKSVRNAIHIGYDKGLKYVYTGNIMGDEGENTVCHQCGEPLIDRTGFCVTRNRLKDHRCPECNAVIPGVWED
jgi:pyruvate formate lyase activating enzyme